MKSLVPNRLSTKDKNTNEGLKHLQRIKQQMSVRFGTTLPGIGRDRDEIIEEGNLIIKSEDDVISKINALKRIISEIKQCEHKMLWGQDKSIEFLIQTLDYLEKTHSYHGKKIKADQQVMKRTNWEERAFVIDENISIEKLERLYAVAKDENIKVKHMEEKLEKYRKRADMGDRLVELYKKTGDVECLMMLNKIRKYCRSKTFDEVKKFNEDKGITF